MLIDTETFYNWNIEVFNMLIAVNYYCFLISIFWKWKKKGILTVAIRIHLKNRINEVNFNFDNGCWFVKPCIYEGESISTM